MRTSLGLALATLAILTGVRGAAAQEKKITRAELPPAVEKTVAGQSQGATIRGFSASKSRRNAAANSTRPGTTGK